MSDFYTLTKEKVNKIYESSLELKQRFNPAVIKDFNIHNDHLSSIGYWSSSEFMSGSADINFKLPNKSNCLVVPMIDGNNQINGIKLLKRSESGNVDITHIGTSKVGWFNLLSEKKRIKTSNEEGIKANFKICDSILTALKNNEYIFSDYIIQENINILGDSSRHINTFGNKVFLKKFRYIEGFDISVGETNKAIPDYCIDDFIYSDLNGTSLKIAKNLAKNFLKTLAIEDREYLNNKFMSIFKHDLKIDFPYLFIKLNDEKVFINSIKDSIASRFEFKSILFSNGITFIKIYDNEKKKETKLTLNEKSLGQYLSFTMGDLLEWCESYGMPSHFFYDKSKDTMLNKYEVYNIIEQLVYRIVLGLCKDINLNG